MSKDWTLEQYAEHYVKTINSPANAWGQHVSSIFGLSHFVIAGAKKRFPADEVDRIFEKACKEYDNRRAP